MGSVPDVGFVEGEIVFDEELPEFFFAGLVRWCSPLWGVGRLLVGNIVPAHFSIRAERSDDRLSLDQLILIGMTPWVID